MNLEEAEAQGDAYRRITECPDCWALVYADRMQAHAYWHDTAFPEEGV